MNKWILLVCMLSLSVPLAVQAEEVSPSAEDTSAAVASSETSAELALKEGSEESVDCFYEANQSNAACAKDKSEGQYALRPY